MVFLHILSGSLGLLFGFSALILPKGQILHRKVGFAFVVAMITMLLVGAIIAVMLEKMLSVLAALLSLYLIVSSFLTVKHGTMSQQLLGVLPIFALFIRLWGLASGAISLTLSNGLIDGQSAYVAVVFGGLALLGCIFDVRTLRTPLGQKARIRRHIWRMCFALLISIASLFFGQATSLPQWMMPLTTGAVLMSVVTATMCYYLIRPTYQVQLKVATRPTQSAH